MKVDLTIAEIENLLMMNERVKNHFDYGYAKSAIKKLNAARKEYLDFFDRRRSEHDDEVRERFTLDLTGGKES